jgi:eukaryotic-like serine/threonine-protein kinase
LDNWDDMALDYLRLGTTLIETGDADNYRNFCELTINRFAGTTNPVVAERTIKISLLMPPDKQILDGLAPFAGTASQAFANADMSDADAVFHAAWGCVSLSLIEYRRGNYAKAADWCRRSLGYSQDNEPRTATAQIILAMSEFQLGQKADATSELAQGRETIENRFQDGLERGDGEQGFWFDWVFGRIILNEAEKLIGQSSLARQ